MSYPPQWQPPGSAPGQGAAPWPDPNAPYPAPHAWGYSGGPGWQTAPPQVERKPGIALAAASVILGALGLVIPVLPVDLTGLRGIVGLPFALGGLALGITVCAGRRRGVALAVVGLVLCGLATVLALALLPASLSQLS